MRHRVGQDARELNGKMAKTVLTEMTVSKIDESEFFEFHRIRMSMPPTEFRVDLLMIKERSVRGAPPVDVEIGRAHV